MTEIELSIKLEGRRLPCALAGRRLRSILGDVPRLTPVRVLLRHGKMRQARAVKRLLKHFGYVPQLVKERAWARVH